MSISLFAISLEFSGLILIATIMLESEWSFCKNFSAFFFEFIAFFEPSNQIW